MAFWWVVLGILLVEDLLTMHLSPWLLWLLALATVLAVAFSWMERIRSSGSSFQNLLVLAGRGLFLCLMAGAAIGFYRAETLGLGDVYVILMISAVFPVMTTLVGLIIGFLHAGVLGMIRMAFMKEESPKIPLVPLLWLGLWCSL